MSGKTLKVGIMSKDSFRKRTMAVAKGAYKPKKSEPQVWFESVQSMAQVVSSSNQELLKAIMRHKPASMKELADITGRKPSNLSRTLHNMGKFGIAELKKRKITLQPIVKLKEFKIEIGLDVEPKRSI